MDFFERQAQAQRNTTLLVAYFVLAVVGIILAIHITFSLILGYDWTNWEALGWTALGVCAAVLVGSLAKMAELASGGRAVAAMLGGVPVDLNTTDPAERRLVNVVEEMSIASGVPVPELFVLDEKGINAFAAGHGPGDSAIGVTRGCVERLTRDELQGVIAHEFSHVLHGDMRLNIRLIGVLNGILFLAVIGGILMRLSIYSRGGGSRRDGGASVVAFLALGIALYIIGWIGVFFGKLIKAAVSREREFLADAAAVQFTRNPDGLAGALAKIAKFSSRLQNPRAEEASHMFFGNGVGDAWMLWFATHPPIDVRIQRIAPGFDLEAAKKAIPVPPRKPAYSEPGKMVAGGRLAEMMMPGQPQVVVAAALLDSLPESAKTAVHELHGAMCLVYSLLLSEDEAIRERQLALVEPTCRSETTAMHATRGALTSAQRLAIVDIAVPTLRHLSLEQYQRFRETVRGLVEADGEIHLFEFTLQKILVRHLDLYFSDQTGPVVRYKSLIPLLPETGVLLSALAIAEGGDADARKAAFSAGVRELLVKPAAYPLECGEAIDLAAFDAALEKLATAAPDVKRTILTACGAVVETGDPANDTQIELLRAIADALDCPLPPFLRTA
ncbi:MAG: M48 family metallopeptidase [Terrimicrobiaceae bacterium]|nr:M48 family metallopeptidase [Terrimicrobiaceae bacterium]